MEGGNVLNIFVGAVVLRDTIIGDDMLGISLAQRYYVVACCGGICCVGKCDGVRYIALIVHNMVIRPIIGGCN